MLVSTVVVVAATAAAAALAGDNDAGFKTARPSMLAPATTMLPGQAPQPGAVAGVSVEPILTVGDRLGKYRFESIPDGISLRARGNGRVDLFVNHETSLVPFPYNLTLLPGTPATPPPHPAEVRETNQNDFDNSQLSLLALNQHSGGVLSGKYAITSDENYQRFCSNYLATRKEGFDRPLLFTNEEAQDWVRRTGVAWDGSGALPGGFFQPGAPGTEQAGLVVAHDVQNGKTRPIYGMGRHNHENSVAIPGYDGVVVLSGDDTFNTTPFTFAGPHPRKTDAWSQLYMYLADDSGAVWGDEGDLYAFQSDAARSYYEVGVGSGPISGRFVKVPRHIARGKDASGAELLGSGLGMDAPPAGTPDGPQWVLDQWGEAFNNEHGKDVFRFVRVEDIAYDKRPGMENVVYIADSGRGRQSQQSLDTAFRSTNGRIWKMVLNPSNPLVVDSLQVLVEGDDNPVSTSTSPANAAELAFGEIRQPDNLETTADGGLFVQEDPGSSQQFSASSTSPFRTTARIWRVNLKAANPDLAKSVVAVVDQAADEDSTDVDGAGANAPPAVVRGALGAWESSGIVDASSVFGAGAFFVTVQAGTLWIEKKDGPDTAASAYSPDYVFKRSGGQLLLIRVPPLTP
jgi:hypothetical protein